MCARNPASPVAWLAGWKTHWSAPPPAQAKGTPRQGGTAVFWRTSGRSQAFPGPLPAAQAHRVCGRVFDGFSVVSFYGNAQFAEPSVLFQVLQTARAFGRPCLVIGDFNWKPAYQCALDASGAVMLPFTASVQGSLVSPCRGLCVEGKFRDATCCSFSLPGVPHHKAVCFSGSWTPAVCEQHSHRFRRCAEYVWHGQTCSPEHQAHFERLCAPPVLHDSPLSERFLAWHGKAEAVCKAATRFGLAQVARKAERARPRLQVANGVIGRLQGSPPPAPFLFVKNKRWQSPMRPSRRRRQSSARRDRLVGGASFGSAPLKFSVQDPVVSRPNVLPIPILLRIPCSKPGSLCGRKVSPQQTPTGTKSAIMPAIQSNPFVTRPLELSPSTSSSVPSGRVQDPPGSMAGPLVSLKAWHPLCLSSLTNCSAFSMPACARRSLVRPVRGALAVCVEGCWDTQANRRCLASHRCC